MTTLLLRHGTVVTMDAACTVIEDGAVFIQDGRLAAVGPDAEVAPRFPAAETLDVSGRAVMPGLINCHTHIPMTLLRGLADDRELMDWLTNYIFPAEARTVNAESVLWGTRLGMWEMLLGGVTTIVDMYYYEDVVARELARVGMRGILSQAMIDFPAPDHKTWQESLEGMEAFASAWKDHPLITPALGPHSPYTLSPEHLQECQAMSVRLGIPLVIHLAESLTEHEQVLRERERTPVSYLDHLGLLTPQNIAAHVVWPEDREIPLLAKRGMGVAHCPHSNAKTASGISPVTKLLAAGVAVGLGTDGAASNNDLDMWQEMQTASFLQKLQTRDPRGLNARETLGLATSTAARAIHREADLGSLEAGKRADVIVVRLDGPHHIPLYDVISQLAYTTKSTDVERVIIEGRTVMANGVVTGIDVTELRAGVEDQKARVLHALKE